MTNPYRVEGPALISFSGGRTSAYMLHQILDAHDGRLPPDVHVCFANTGKEREETLRFVHECGSRWGVDIRWLEFRSRLKSVPVAERFAEVGLNSASRRGEPFKLAIEAKQAVPNAVQRWCTELLKILVLSSFMEAQGYPRWLNVVGLRADEVRRAAKRISQNDEGKFAWVTVMPLLRAGVTKRMIWKFWLGPNADPKSLTHPLPQGFDLGLYPYEGNCDACFNKAREVLMFQERERPGSLSWWIAMEALSGARFVTEYSYADLQRDVERQPLLLPLDGRDTEYVAECGVSGTDHRIRCGKAAA